MGLDFVIYFHKINLIVNCYFRVVWFIPLGSSVYFSICLVIVFYCIFQQRRVTILNNTPSDFTLCIFILLVFYVLFMCVHNKSSQINIPQEQLKLLKRRVGKNVCLLVIKLFKNENFHITRSYIRID